MNVLAAAIGPCGLWAEQDASKSDICTSPYTSVMSERENVPIKDKNNKTVKQLSTPSAEIFLFGNINNDTEFPRKDDISGEKTNTSSPINNLCVAPTSTIKGTISTSSTIW